MRRTRPLLRSCRLAVAIVGLLLAGLAVETLAPAPAVAKRSGPRRRTVVYTVKRGDTLARIARRFRVTIPQIRRWNRLKSDRIIAGRRLRIAAPTRSPSRGPALTAAVPMPPGKGYYLKNPDESWGTARTIRALRAAFAAFREKHPESADIVLGDISLPKGGYFPPHRSHRDGRDVDIGLMATQNRRLTHFARLDHRTLDREKTWDLVEALLETGEVELILLDRSHQRLLHRVAKRRGYSEQRLSRLFQWPRSRRTRVGLIRHARGHDDHLHVRFREAPAPVAAAPEGPGGESAAVESAVTPPPSASGAPRPIPGASPARTRPDGAAPEPGTAARARPPSTVPGPVTRD